MTTAWVEIRVEIWFDIFTPPARRARLRKLSYDGRALSVGISEGEEEGWSPGIILVIMLWK